MELMLMEPTTVFLVKQKQSRNIQSDPMGYGYKYLGSEHLNGPWGTWGRNEQKLHEDEIALTSFESFYDQIENIEILFSLQ